MTDKEAIKASKFLSLILRHEPERVGLTLGEAGWVSVEELLQAVNRHGCDPGQVATLMGRLCRTPGRIEGGRPRLGAQSSIAPSSTQTGSLIYESADTR